MRLCLVSDESGNLLEHFVNAILTQYPRQSFEVETFPFVKTEEDLAKTVLKCRKGIIFHALASSPLKTKIARECAKEKIPCLDVTGLAAEFLEKAAKVRPFAKPQAVHRVDREYIKRMDALEFAIQHDDNRRIEELENADIIVVGISRVSKSPNALFLAYRGFRVANVSIVPENGLPQELEKHSKPNVVALTIQPKTLSEIRSRRFAKWEFKNFQYEDLQAIIHEVVEAEKIYKRKKWPVIDTTTLAVEETSAMILSALKLKPKVLEWL
ncbi:MAG: pyruvate, phosphate dikinase/phosphoenolpyruvate synthase regulator [Candidatus Omnitrophica bacterium]|nr:pyruvate, phosphate dikinase/phosphoenolpyruvate synthase regulator [Candidatus Omnitrophota bacterium]